MLSPLVGIYRIPNLNNFSIAPQKPEPPLVNLFLRAFSMLPLRWNHRIGALLGRLIYKVDRTYAKRMRDNLALSGIAKAPREFEALLRESIIESGKAATEVVIAWLRPPKELSSLVRECYGWKYVEQALQRGRGVIFVTPHLGCFELAGRYLADRLEITIMHRPPKLAWAARLMDKGREHSNAVMVPADMRGVRSLLKTLKRGGNICILPDQAPGQGDGVWTDFFGKPAYTMTLIGRLQHSTDATVLMFFGERLSQGAGYRIWIEPLNAPLAAAPDQAARQINAAVEKLVRQCPAQYLWSYNRYKAPAGAPKTPPKDAQ
ncbi:MAG TPA: lysophospholipid acyltransferase family protein [Burkholderiales bacterium]|nr:lysophospholipid acyltransferase family protein [Burkholderiales bacterium]